MFRELRFPNPLIKIFFTLAVLLGAVISVSAQQTTEKRPVLEVEGNKIFSQTELLSVVNDRLDEWAEEGATYNSDQLDYGIHLLDQFMKSRGYLQARATKNEIKETAAGPCLVLTISEGPLYRIGEVTIDGARLFSTEEILKTIGLRTADIANGELISKGLFETLKTRYAKFGYIQYTADVNPVFHAKEGATEGVVDFQITIDEADQFRIRSIKLVGTEQKLIDLLSHDLLLRDGDIFDDELFHESVKRLNQTGLVGTIDADKDVEFFLQDKHGGQAGRRGQLPDNSPPLMDLKIHVKRSTGSDSRP